METSDKKFVIRSRGIILHEGKLMLVRHNPNDQYLALPGGKLDFGEDIESCMRRELKEELGIEPIIGRLLYIHTFVQNGQKQSIEFFFEITNGKDFVDYKKHERTHAQELSEIIWIDPSSTIKILPEQIGKDFKNGTLLSDNLRFI